MCAWMYVYRRVCVVVWILEGVSVDVGECVLVNACKVWIWQVICWFSVDRMDECGFCLVLCHC